MKDAGIDGVIIRCGFGTNIKGNDDKFFLKNLKGCIENNIPFGVYLYSYADTIERAESEARHVIRLVAPYKDKLAFPIFYDLEHEDKEKNIYLGEYAIEMGNKFIEIMENNGYEVGIYSGQKWFDTYIKDNFNNYPLWVARYGPDDGEKHIKPEVPNDGKIDIWQYTSKGKIDGINGNVDLNVCYREIVSQTTSDLLSISGNEQIVPLTIQCQSNGEDMKFYKKNFNSGNFNAFNIYRMKTNHCQKSTLEMMEEMVRNYGPGYEAEYYELFERIYNTACQVKMGMDIEYVNKEGFQKQAKALCYGKCIEGSIARLTCFFQAEDINTNKKIYSNGMSGYASNNKCILENFLNLETLIKESEEDRQNPNESIDDKKETEFILNSNESDNNKIEKKESTDLNEFIDNKKETELILNSNESDNGKIEEKESTDLNEFIENKKESELLLNSNEFNNDKIEEKESTDSKESDGKKNETEILLDSNESKTDKIEEKESSNLIDEIIGDSINNSDYLNENKEFKNNGQFIFKNFNYPVILLNIFLLFHNCLL